MLERVDAARGAGVYSLFPRVEARGECGHVRLDGGPAVSLIANDYLGLSGHPAVRAAAAEAIERFGTSRCASPLVGGYTALHEQLERELCDFLGQEACATFASGYQANVGAVSALMRPHDVVVTDLFDHASIVDGARLSGADIRFFNHNDAEHLEQVLRGMRPDMRALVIVEGVYSADGDVVRLDGICAVAHARGALVMVDEAHSLGVLGARGDGAAASFDLLGEVDLLMGTMSKSLGSVGGFVAGDRSIVEAIRHEARALVFSAALAPANAAAALASLGVLRDEPQLRERLWNNTERMHAGLETLGFDTLDSTTPVIPVLVGRPDATLALSAELARSGVLVCPAIPPMVQAHRSRIRGHVTAAHDAAGLDRALELIAATAAALGIRNHTGVT